MLEGIIRDSMTKQATKTLRRNGYLILDKNIFMFYNYYTMPPSSSG